MFLNFFFHFLSILTDEKKSIGGINTGNGAMRNIIRFTFRTARLNSARTWCSTMLPNIMDRANGLNIFRISILIVKIKLWPYEWAGEFFEIIISTRR